MVNYGFGMPTRLVADGDVARWCGRLVAHYGGTKALVVLGGDKHTRDELVSAALGSVDRALLERVLFRCGSAGDGGDELIDEAVALATDEGVDFVLAIGDADTAGFARELARRMAALDAGEDGFVPYGCIVSEGKVPAVVGAGEVPVFCHHCARIAGGYRVSSARAARQCVRRGLISAIKGWVIFGG